MDKSYDAAPEKSGEAGTDNVSPEVVAATAFLAGSAFDIEKDSATTTNTSVVTLDEDMGGMTGSALFSSRDLSK